jgi:hypothetical protein
MKRPEPGEHSHGKEHHRTERDYTKHMRDGVKHLEHHMREEPRAMERREPREPREPRKEGHR